MSKKEDKEVTAQEVNQDIEEAVEEMDVTREEREKALQGIDIALKSIENSDPLSPLDKRVKGALKNLHVYVINLEGVLKETLRFLSALLYTEAVTDTQILDLRAKFASLAIVLTESGLVDADDIEKAYKDKAMPTVLALAQRARLEAMREVDPEGSLEEMVRQNPSDESN
jgi:hypothetical protein